MLSTRAPRKPREADKPKLLSFDKAIEGLKAAKNGFFQCVAFSSYGRCQKYIDFKYADLQSLLEQLDTTDKSTIVHLVHLMLCPTHWPQTVYYCAIFLQFIFDSELSQNIIIDLESAKTIEEEGYSVSKSVVSNGITKGQEGQRSATSRSKEAGSFTISNSSQIPASLTSTTHLSRVISTTSSLQTSPRTASPGSATNNETQGHTSDAIPENGQAHMITKPFYFSSSQSYALLEFGVVRLEIICRTSLNCIIMSPNGWRCKVLIPNEQLFEARSILCSLSGATDEFQNLSKLLLCPGHSDGDLPQRYGDAWSEFAANRLPKKEALSNFEKERWNLASKQSKSLAGTPSANPSFLLTSPKTSNLTSKSSTDSTSVIDSGTTESTVGRSSLLSLEKGIKVPFPSPNKPNRSITVKFPPSPSNEPDEISKISSELSHTKISNEASSHSRSSSITTLDIQDTAASKDNRETLTLRPSQSLATPKLQRDSKPQIKMLSQSKIHDNIVNEMLSSISRGGYVYVLKSVSLKLLKIGQATDVALRIKEIKAECPKFNDLIEVNSDSYRVSDPERVLELITAELENFRVAHLCPSSYHGGSGGGGGDAREGNRQTHENWFDVPDNVAVQSVQRWREFVEKAYTPEGTIRGIWARRVALLPRPSDLEMARLEVGLEERSESQLGKYHQLRHERYWKWMKNV